LAGCHGAIYGTNGIDCGASRENGGVNCFDERNAEKIQLPENCRAGPGHRAQPAAVAAALLLWYRGASLPQVDGRLALAG
jgi:hypothetical protein